jgi:putative endonuclease
VARRDTRAVGNKVERIAQRFLQQNGLITVAKNFCCRSGEIDLIMLDVKCLVFVEVRYRAARQRVPAKLTVDARKQNKLVKTAAIFLAKHDRYTCHTVRFDVIGVDDDELEWIRDAFRPAHSGY